MNVAAVIIYINIFDALQCPESRDGKPFSLNGSQIRFYFRKKEKWVIDLTIL